MKTVKDLCVAVGKYTAGGVQKQSYKKIGVEITEEKDGKLTSYILLDRFVSLAGFPNFSEKINSTSVLVSKFDNSNDSPAPYGEVDDYNLNQKNDGEAF